MNNDSIETVTAAKNFKTLASTAWAAIQGGARSARAAYAAQWRQGSNWFRRLARRRPQFEPEALFAANRRADSLVRANARMTDDGGPPRDE